MSFGLGGKVHIICKMNAKIPLTPVVFLDGKEAGGQSAHKHIFLGGGGWLVLYLCSWEKV